MPLPKNVIEVEAVALPAIMRPHRYDNRFLVVTEDGQQSALMSYPDAILTANELPGTPIIGFLVAEPEPTAVAMVPSYISRKKRK